MGDDDGMMLTAYQREAVEFYRRTEDAEAQADELRALLPEPDAEVRVRVMSKSPPVIELTQEESAKFLNGLGHALVSPTRDDGSSKSEFRPAILAEPAPPRFNPDLAAEGARLVEAAAGPGARAAVAHWMEQDARRQQQARVAVRVLEALRRAAVFRPCETAFRADWDSEEDARFVFDALGEWAP